MTAFHPGAQPRRRLITAALLLASVAGFTSFAGGRANAAGICSGYNQTGASVYFSYVEKGTTQSDPSNSGDSTVCDATSVTNSRHDNNIIGDPTYVYGSLVQRGEADMRTGVLKAYANNAFAWDRNTVVSLADIVTFDLTGVQTDANGYAKVTLLGTLDGVFNSRSARSSAVGNLAISAWSLTSADEPIEDSVSIGVEDHAWNEYQEGMLKMVLRVRHGEQWYISSTFSAGAANYEEWTGGYASADLLNTAHLTMTTPRGMSYTSGTGAFLADLPTAAVPEPASWAMMIGGFGLTGGLMRRRRRAGGPALA